MPRLKVNIHLKASVKALFTHIYCRRSEFEKKISPDYIDYLNRVYVKWMKETRESGIGVVLKVDEVDYIREDDKFVDLVNNSCEYCL